MPSHVIDRLSSRGRVALYVVGIDSGSSLATERSPPPARATSK
jgi:hypothetical protein